MSAAGHIGRVGALAGALGAGVAILSGPITNPAAAWAAGPEAAGPSAPDSPSAAPAGRATAAPSPGAARRDATGSAPADRADAGPARPARGGRPESRVGEADAAPGGEAVGPLDPVESPEPVELEPFEAVEPVEPRDPVESPEPVELDPVEPVEPRDPVEPAEPVETIAAPPVSPASDSAGPATEVPAVGRIAAAITSAVSGLGRTGNAPLSPPAESPAAWMTLAAARRQPAAAATADSKTAASLPPALLALDGYDVVPSSTKTVNSFTGRWSYFPANPNMIQGRQDFHLVDPATKARVGGFSALVTTGDPTSIGASYAQLLVTANDGANVGAAAGQTPPVGSLISSLSLGPLELSYTSMPTASGSQVSTTIKTPLGKITLPLKYDAADGIAGRTFDNRPIALGDGYRIAPISPKSEKVTATIGLLPVFNSVQGRQTFGVFDSTGAAVGSFEGEFTTTSDLAGIYTQAILVTANDGVNVGAGPGQTPPVGSVYNVGYFGSDRLNLLYSSKPRASGDVVSITLDTPLGAVNLPKELFNSLNASREPELRWLSAPGGQRLVATSGLVPAGVNGLPPRDVQVQGYQQFDVSDLLGNKIGSVDAHVVAQWDGYGVHSRSLLVTDVREGRTGSLPFDVPPVGTVLNFVFLTGGYGFADAVIPQPGGQVSAWKFITPLGDIPLLPLPQPVGYRPDVDYANPFAR